MKTLQLEQMAVTGRAEEPSLVASRMRLVFSTLEVGLLYFEFVDNSSILLHFIHSFCCCCRLLVHSGQCDIKMYSENVIYNCMNIIIYTKKM